MDVKTTVRTSTGSPSVRGRAARTLSAIAVTATAGLLITACAAAGVDPASPTATTPPTPAPSTTATATTVTSAATAAATAASTDPTAEPTTDRAPGILARAQIPWSRVGPGWSGVVVVPIPISPSTDLGAIPGTLYLVGPDGARYAIGATAAGERVTDVTPDGRRILTSRGGPGTQEVVTRLWDTRTGVARTIATGMADGSFSRPRGTAVVGTVLGTDAAYHLRRYGLDGDLQLTYSLPGGAGAPTSVVRPPDGLSLVIGTRTGIAVLANTTGTTMRMFPTPPGASFCRPASMWTSTQILVGCDSNAIGSSASDLFTVPVAGGPMTRLPVNGSSDRDGGNGFGFVGAWHSTVGVVLQRGSGCGNGGYAMWSPDGRVSDLRFPESSTSAGGPVVLDVVGSTALLSVTSGEGGCGGGQYQTLVSHDLATGATRPLVGPLAGTGALYGPPVVLERTG